MGTMIAVRPCAHQVEPIALWANVRFERLLLAVRITREERLLAEALDGYQEYRRKVRYRLLPLVW
jgi:protein-S-isoprenylcysteine O-methyltransferase Ste14